MDSEPNTLAVSEPVETPMTSFGGLADMSGDNKSVDTSFLSYPSTRPFTNTDYERCSTKPSMSFPESNRDGVLSALQSLQEKMQKLEMERKEAESNLQTLATETELYKSSLQQNHYQHIDSTPPTRQEPEVRENGVDAVSSGNDRPEKKNLETQLSSAETRCQLLEKQLDYMRKMVQTAERDRVDAVNRAETLQQHQQALNNPSPFTPDYSDQLERIGELEQDHERLTATQSQTETRIRELENKLKNERDHRRLLQEKALDLQSAAAAHKILHTTAMPAAEKHSSIIPTNSKTKKSAASKKKKKKVAPKKQAPVKSEPSKHYRLNLADIPFVAGKSTAPSHAVGANVQKVLAMMKSHNLALCSTLYNGHGSCNGHTRRSNSPSLTAASMVNVDQDLADLLAQLQDEFGQLSFEHQEYMHQIHETDDSQLREDLERELDALVIKMEAKGQQISKVRQHQQKLEDAMRQSKRVSKKSEHITRPNSAMGRLQANHKHVHSHSVDQQANSSGNIRPKSSLRSDREQKYQELAPPSLNVLRDMRKLQCTLRRDDLCWE